ncbi:SMC-Scp complex subunit ScpB [Candidatus Bathyarchaeota archaeon]|nr:SMC-Scp complex subunit ScpB [Candidatus Bathyarchaeota archaeon]
MQTAEEDSSNSDNAFKQEKAEQKLRQQLSLVEAAMYVAGRPLTLKKICSVLETRSKSKAQRLARILMKKYEKRNTALEILELKDERYVLQLKPEFTPRVQKLAKKPLITKGPLKTLAYIAYRQPISQNRVANMRGHHAYGHIKLMKEMDLVYGERKGRSTILRTTDYFADYFGLSHELPAMKRQLKKVFEEEMENADRKDSEI